MSERICDFRFALCSLSESQCGRRADIPVRNTFESSPVEDFPTRDLGDNIANRKSKIANL